MTGRLHIPGVTIEAELGRGAHSIVYRGRTGGGAPCAVKVPRTKGRWTRWVYREAVALARVRDPNLPEVIEVGEVDELPYLVMELVEGETLADRIARGPISLGETLDIVVTVVQALRSVHDVGLVHRDVKPGNLIFGAKGRVRLVDFGFATPIERVGTTEAAGTPGYSAPEQLRAPARVDGRADLYAVGCVMLACLAPTRDVATFALPGVSDQVLLRFEGGAAVARVARDLLAPDPDARYPDATAVLLDLVLIGNGEVPVGAASAARTPRTRPWVGRAAALQRVVRGWDAHAGAVAVVAGARGAGKSRFLDAAIDRWRAGRRGPALVVHCREGDPPLSTLRRLVDAYLDDAMRTGTSTDAERALREAVGEDLEPFATLIAPRLAERLGAGPAGEPASMSAFPEAAAELFVRLARSAGPMLVAVDDAAWADPASSEVLFRLAHRAVDVPLALVLTSRPGVRSLVERLLELDASRLTSIQLGELDHDEVSALVSAHLGRSDLDPGVARRIAVLSDRTPLGVLETLRAFLDAGALRPHHATWAFDLERAENVTLPEGSLDLLTRRVAELPAATRRVLVAAAILGASFEDTLLAELLQINLDELDFGLADARRAGVLEASRRGRHAFSHEGFRESCLRSLDPQAARALHQATAEVLERRGAPNFEALCQIALHFAQGELEVAPARAFAAARRAASVALVRGDEHTALRFFTLARRAAELAQLRVDGSFFRDLGEAHLRAGALAASLDGFEQALDVARDPAERASILGRIAWVHQSAADPEPSWAALGRAFASLGERLPAEDAGSVANALRSAARRGLRKVRRTPSAVSSPASDLLCELHYQNARLGLEYGRPLRLIESTVAVLDLSDAAGRSRTRARALAMYGVALTALGRRRAGAGRLAEAEEMAQSLADPPTRAFCVQLRSLGACWSGDFDFALRLNESLLEHAHWLELNELCLAIANADLIESVRGRSEASMGWLARGVARVRRSAGANDSMVDYLFHRVGATHAALATDEENLDAWVRERLAAARAHAADSKGILRLLSWGARVRAYTEADGRDAELDATIQAFEAEQIDPRSAHPTVAEYYIAVAHARVHAILTLPGSERREGLARLRKAAADLRLAAKIPLFRAHALVIDAHVAWFDGKASEASRLFREAAALAEEETCPWVLYAVARARAHQLRDAGKTDAALDQARLAESLAREHGAAVRARWIREEFALPAPAVEPRSSSARTESRVSSRQLAALLHVLSSGGRALRPDEQAAAVMNDILLDLECERGALLFQPDLAAGSRLVVGRTRGGEAVSCEGWREDVLRTTRETGSSWPSDESDWLDHVVGHDAPDSRRLLVVPLMLHERTAGALCLERARDAPPFGTDERELLLILAKQVPFALEMARLVAEREQLQASLQQAQRMEAVGQLAGGVAHDFNNMLTAIQTSLVALHDRVRGDADAAAEVDLIDSASRRAAQLTTKLLAFSRHQPVPLAPCDVNELLRGLAPMLRRLVGSAVNVSLELEPGAHLVSTDRAAFEQALVNLAVNARDAMPAGGQLVISTANAVLDAGAVRRGAPREGAYLRVVVRDDGQGISPDLVSRVFEPFFTTKGPGGGTGLGLTTVYAFVKNCGGHIDVTSEVGQGTSFRIHLPAEQNARPARVRRATPIREMRGRAETILVVDDEHLVARSIQKTLQRKGYEVLLANDAARAIELVEERSRDISLVIIDMLMPGMTGPELGKRLVEMQLPAKLLYVSGFSPGNLPLEEPDFDPSCFLQKPFTPSDLLGRVGQLLDSS